MKPKVLAIVLILAISVSGCFSLFQQSPGEKDSPVSENRCGDDVCDGPETVQNCPEDCSPAALDDSTTDDPQEKPTDAQTGSDENYRYVSFSGTIHTSQNDEAMGDFTGRVIEYSGDYSVKLWFPLDGGEAVYQESFIVLTDYRDRLIGEADCAVCQWTLDESAYEPVEIHLDAHLTLNGITEGDQPADELVYRLLEIPATIITGEVVCCGAPGPVNDPAAIPVLTSWFMLGVTNPIHLDLLETNTVEDFPISPVANIDIPLETVSYTIVKGLTQP